MTAKPARREALEKLGDRPAGVGGGDGLRRLETVAQEAECGMTGWGTNGDLEQGWEARRWEGWDRALRKSILRIETRKAEESQGTSGKSEQQCALTLWTGGQLPSGRDCPALYANVLYRF